MLWWLGWSIWRECNVNTCKGNVKFCSVKGKGSTMRGVWANAWSDFRLDVMYDCRGFRLKPRHTDQDVCSNAWGLNPCMLALLTWASGSRLRRLWFHHEHEESSCEQLSFHRMRICELIRTGSVSKYSIRWKKDLKPDDHMTLRTGVKRFVSDYSSARNDTFSQLSYLEKAPTRQ